MITDELLMSSPSAKPVGRAGVTERENERKKRKRRKTKEKMVGPFLAKFLY